MNITIILDWLNRTVPEPSKQLLIVFDHYDVASDDEVMYLQ